MPTSVAGRLVGDQLAVVDDRDPVAQLLGFLEIMGGEHDGHALRVELRGHSPRAAGAARRRRRRSARRAPGSAANGPSPWRPAAAASSRPTACAHRRRPCPPDGPRGAAPSCAARPWGCRRARPGSPAPRSGVKKGSNRISCGTMPIERLALRGCSSMSKPQIVARAAGLVDQPGEDVDQRRLAGAVRAEQPEDAAARHVEADPVQRALAACIGLCTRSIDRDGGFGSHRPQAHSRSSCRVPWRQRRESLFAESGVGHGRDRMPIAIAEAQLTPIRRPKSACVTRPRRLRRRDRDRAAALGHPRVWLQIDEKAMSIAAIATGASS